MAVNEANVLMKPTCIMIAQVNRYPNEKPPPIEWAIYLSLLETRVAYRVLGVIFCCLRSPPPLLVERSKKKKKKKSCSIGSLLSDKLPEHCSKTFGNSLWFICCLWFVVFWVCWFLREAKQRVFDGAGGSGQEPASAPKVGEAGSRAVEKEGSGLSSPGVGKDPLSPFRPGLGQGRCPCPH